MREIIENSHEAATSFVPRAILLIQGMTVTINSACYSFIRSSHSVFVGGAFEFHYTIFRSTLLTDPLWLLFQLFLIPFFFRFSLPSILPSNLINILLSFRQDTVRDEHVVSKKARAFAPDWITSNQLLRNPLSNNGYIKPFWRSQRTQVRAKGDKKSLITLNIIYLIESNLKNPIF